MSQNIKIMCIAAAVSLAVSVASFFGLFAMMRYAGGIFPSLENYFPQRIHEREIVKEPSVVEKYVPQTTHEQMIVDIVKRSQDAVVSVIATKDLPVIEQYYQDPFQGLGLPNDFFGGIQIPHYRQKGGATQKQEVSSGTGFIVASNGIILTNKHVVSDEGAAFTVLMNNGDKYPAKVLARDPLQDVAILKIEKKGLPILTLGNSDSIQTGQTVIAIGNALGEFRNTVSVGVISGLRRTITAGGAGMTETLEDLIQTDAAINPGNSGGPLLNLSGEVIGMNTAMSQDAQNIGFAFPINKAKKDIEQVENTGKITYPFLGVRYVMIDADLQKKNNLPVDYGVLVARGETSVDLAVVPGSPADVVGIVENDIITEVNGKKITKDHSLATVIQSSKVGDVVTLEVLHKGKEETLTVTLTERK